MRCDCYKNVKGELTILLRYLKRHPVETIFLLLGVSDLIAMLFIATKVVFRW